jgi:hypothetical protein
MGDPWPAGGRRVAPSVAESRGVAAGAAQRAMLTPVLEAAACIESEQT